MTRRNNHVYLNGRTPSAAIGTHLRSFAECPGYAGALDPDDASQSSWSRWPAHEDLGCQQRCKYRGDGVISRAISLIRTWGGLYRKLRSVYSARHMSSRCTLSLYTHSRIACLRIVKRLVTTLLPNAGRASHSAIAGGLEEHRNLISKDFYIDSRQMKRTK